MPLTEQQKPSERGDCRAASTVSEVVIYRTDLGVVMMLAAANSPDVCLEGGPTCITHPLSNVFEVCGFLCNASPSAALLSERFSRTPTFDQAVQLLVQSQPQSMQHIVSQGRR